MSQDFGNGVSRTLSALERQFQVVVWQSGKPPLDSELNLMMQADWERLSNTVRALMPSGWLIDPFNSDADFETNPLWSNFFKMGKPGDGETSPALWANVNGWIVPVTGTSVPDGDSSNKISLYPPPSSDTRTDFIFLEVWLAQVSPNPSVLNKPSASTIYKWGNTVFGGTNIPDDLEDPNIGFETTERVQLQYRIRTFGQGNGAGSSIDLMTFPDGLDDPNVLAQGGAALPQLGFTWQNMRDELGDPGLWRSGDGDYTNALGSVDGYSYAIPLCAIFRRNTAAFVARMDAGNANQNGALNRNPISIPITNPLQATEVITPISLTSALGVPATPAVATVVQVNDLVGSGFDNPNLDWTSVFLVIDDEIIGISGVNTGVSPGTITIRADGRGRYGTQAVPHAAGSEARFFIYRPDGKAADQITPTDILDLRKAVTAGEWPYQALLGHNLGKLFNNSLHSSYKQAEGSDTEGPVIIGVDTLDRNVGVTPAQTGLLDGPDGIRTVFSDASVIEDASLILKPVTGGGGTPSVVSDYASGTSTWPAADFDTSGWQPNNNGWANGTIIDLNIGGSTTNDGARASFRTTSNRLVRYVTPREFWLGDSAQGAQTPVQLRFFEQSWGEPSGASEAASPGPMYPLPQFNFESPFVFLGGTVNPVLHSTVVSTVAAGSVPTGRSQVRFPGLDFDAAGAWTEDAGNPRVLSTSGITDTLLYGSRNLYDMLTAGGKDITGQSSELYLVLRGDAVNAVNAGVFRVIGAGTIGYTYESAATADGLVVQRVGVGSSTLVATVNLTAEVRSQYTNTEDGSDPANGPSAVVVITDIAAATGGATNPWNGLLTAPVVTQAILDTKVLYGPSRGGTIRVADTIDRVAIVAPSTAELVREAPTDLDPNFALEAGVPTGENYFPTQLTQVWNQLPSLGLSAPLAPDYGDGTYLKDQRREAEIFIDPGSKTIIIRPLQRVDAALYRHQAGSGTFIPSTYTAGPFLGAIDGGALFTVGRDYGYSVPWEFMPKFGRQDIPYHQTTGATGTVFVGVNHLFGDSLTPTDSVFRVVGGNTTSGGVVKSIFMDTGAASGRDYGEFGVISGSSEGYQARIYEDVNVYSSDLPGCGLKGIQLPPFLGVSRLYAVYDRREFIAAGGASAYATNRVTVVTPPAGRPTNLLRSNSDKQTLFILKGGASDVTGNDNDHTYIIPSGLIDVELSGDWVPGDTFDNMEFVVECVVFGFARGFINQNNYVLARRFMPDGTLGTAVPVLANAVSMILPRPLPLNDQVYVAYRRTVYQGDPYMTRYSGGSPNPSDYTPRLGQIPQSSAILVATAIQQFDSTADCAQVPEIPNPRSLEILASMDFWTTLGTGKISGAVYPGTVTDIGHVTNFGRAPTRIPAVGTDPMWQSEVRSFTEGQLPRSGFASLEVEITDVTTLVGETITLLRGDQSTTLTAVASPAPNSATQFQVAVTEVGTATNLRTALGLSDIAKNIMGIRAVRQGNSVLMVSRIPGTSGGDTKVALGPAPGSAVITGLSLAVGSPYGLTENSSNLIGGVDLPMNAKYTTANTPIRMSGMTERLPLGILVQDADFIGEDPLRDGTSALRVIGSGGTISTHALSPVLGSEEYGRIEGSGILGMADGGILQYQAWSALAPSGSRAFRLYRGSGSLYVLDPRPEGGPVDFSAGGLPGGEHPVIKGAVLAGRAFLVRNYPEEAFSTPIRRSWGDELQMVIVTQAHFGDGPDCQHGYPLDGQIGPTGYGEGFAAADRYRLEGKPLVGGFGPTGPDPDIRGELAPYPSEDPNVPPC